MSVVIVVVVLVVIVVAGIALLGIKSARVNYFIAVIGTVMVI